jgi:DNA polymerase-3 subunit gamma/tau
MTNALYRQWRPQTWDEIVGQDHIVRTLRNAVGAGRIGHAFLFAGPRGTGKTSTARILAKAVNCLAEPPSARPCNVCGPCQAVVAGRFLDLIEIDAASNTSVEDVRELRDRIHFSPNEGRAKVYLIDEVHMLSTAAFNALLKTLEEPPAHAIFILATTEVHKVPATVVSRCQRHEFRRVPLTIMTEYLARKLEAEGRSVESGVLEAISRHATGSLRDAISLLDQLASLEEPLTLGEVQTVLGTADDSAVAEILRAWAGEDAAAGLRGIGQAIDAGTDPRSFARQLVEWLRGVLLAKLGNPEWIQAPAETRAEMGEVAAKVSLPALVLSIRAFGRAAGETRSSWQPALALELAFLESVEGLQPSGPAEPPSTGKAKPAPGESPAARSEPRGTRGGQTSPGAAPAASVGAPGIQDVLGRWQEILKAAYASDPKTQALLNSSRPLGMEGAALVLGFQSDLLREKMEKGNNLSVVQGALQSVLGVPVRLRCVLTQKWAGSRPSPEETPPMDEEGMVATALRDLGAHVVEIKTIPPESAA